jgi:hypothetical protein
VQPVALAEVQQVALILLAMELLLLQLLNLLKVVLSEVAAMVIHLPLMLVLEELVEVQELVLVGLVAGMQQRMELPQLDMAQAAAVDSVLDKALAVLVHRV